MGRTTADLPTMQGWEHCIYFRHEQSSLNKLLHSHDGGIQLTNYYFFNNSGYLCSELDSNTGPSPAIYQLRDISQRLRLFGHHGRIRMSLIQGKSANISSCHMHPNIMNGISIWHWKMYGRYVRGVMLTQCHSAPTGGTW